MKLAKQTGVAIDALAYMARRGELVTVQDVDRALGQSYNTWSVLRLLSLAGILHSKAGRNGGFTLAKPLKEISLIDVMTATEGPMFPVPATWTKASEKASAVLYDILWRQTTRLSMADLVAGTVVA
jgi:Rrf2 family protein